MIERLVPAKNGYTVYVGDTALHSRYNPRLEAEKYAASLELEKSCRYFILMEPGLDYLGSVLRRRFPRAAVITLHCSAFFADKKLRPLCGGEAEDGSPGLSWNPLCGEGLESFLERTVAADARTIRLVEWRPSVHAYGKAYLDLAGRTVECIRRINAGSVTVRNFGRRWLKNALRNLPLFLYPVKVRRGTGAVVVCAAGPSLEESLDLIIRWRASSPPPPVIAVSSAVPALLHRGIAPDLVIATDGGGWALFHLYGSFRSDKNGAQFVLTAGLTAALPSQTERLRVLILSDGTLWQELLLGSHPFLRLPQRGTVSASALDLALFLSTGNVYLAGLDLTHRDLRTHARPYTFETAMDRSSCRFKPFHSRAFEREGIIRSSGSQDIYAAWFRTYLDSFPKRIFTLGGGRDLGIPPCPGVPAMAETGGKPPVFLPVPAAGTEPRRGVPVLLEALDNPRLGARLSKELGELLIPGVPPESGGFSGALRNELLDLR
ncbi:MAG: DUF115 domain-containing protein [Treponema sp.]|jgi:hypothetical protein|nr:DUF115 domain-containing protein [Treponema sp.]